MSDVPGSPRAGGEGPAALASPSRFEPYTKSSTFNGFAPPFQAL
jgi:hypothetical protein